MVDAASERASQMFDSEDDLLMRLPGADTRHWVPRHKAAVVAAVREGVMSLPQACERYMLTEEEFCSWTDAIDQHGLAGLQASMRAERRKAVRQTISEAGMAMVYATKGIDCLITDISDQGARLKFEAPISLPSTFELRCNQSGRSWWVSVAWRRAETVGARFSNPLPPPWVIRSGLGAWLLGKRRTVSIDSLDAR